MRYNNLILFLLLALLLPSCTFRPNNVLSKKKMEQVLYDLHKADGVVSVEGLNNKDEELKRIYKTTLDKHHVTQAQFDSSLVWYTDNPKRFNKIYPAVLKRLQADLDAFAYLDEQKSVIRIEPSDVEPYDFDSLNSVFARGLIVIYTPKEALPYVPDTTLRYVFPLEVMDTILIR